MPAPNVKAILRYEAAILEAWQQILIKGGVPTEKIFQEFLQATSVAPRVEINLTGIKPTGHRGVFKPGQLTFDAWHGSLITRVITRRSLNGQDHDDILAIARFQALYFNENFTAALLPYHVMTKIQESITHRMIDRERDEDMSELEHEVLFSVRAVAWPPA